MNPERLKSKVLFEGIITMQRTGIEWDKWRNHLLETLDFIRCNADFAGLSSEYYPGLTPNQISFISSAYSKLKEARGNEWTAGIPQLEIPILDDELEKHHPTFLIGGKIEGENDKVTMFSFSLCIAFRTGLSYPNEYTNTPSYPELNVNSCCLPRCLDKKRIVRRFHFDFQPGECDKPTFHIQYGGSFPEKDFYKDWHYCLESFLEEPRLHYLPMDFVLLFDMIIRQFTTPLAKWKQEKGWRRLVFKSQDLLWEYYWKLLSEYFNYSLEKTIHERMYNEEGEL